MFFFIYIYVYINVYIDIYIFLHIALLQFFIDLEFIISFQISYQFTKGPVNNETNKQVFVLRQGTQSGRLKVKATKGKTGMASKFSKELRSMHYKGTGSCTCSWLTFDRVTKLFSRGCKKGMNKSKRLGASTKGPTIKKDTKNNKNVAMVWHLKKQ